MNRFKACILLNLCDEHSVNHVISYIKTLCVRCTFKWVFTNDLYMKMFCKKDNVKIASISACNSSMQRHNSHKFVYIKIAILLDKRTKLQEWVFGNVKLVLDFNISRNSRDALHRIQEFKSTNYHRTPEIERCGTVLLHELHLCDITNHGFCSWILQSVNMSEMDLSCFSFPLRLTFFSLVR